MTIPATGLTQPKEEKTREKEKTKEPWSHRKPHGRLTVTQGYVRIYRADGQTLEVTDINTDIDVDTIDKIQGDFRLALVGGGKLQGDFDVVGATAGLENMQAAVNIKTDEPLNLESMAVLVGPDITTGGRAAMTAATTVRDGQVQSDFALDLTRLKAGRRSDDLQPVDIKLTGMVETGADKIIGVATLSGDIGHITDRFEMPVKFEPVAWDPSTLPAVLEGEKDLVLPDFSLTADGSIDLATLAGAVPALLQLLSLIHI